MVEPFTAHYVFALGVARLLGCAHWIIQFIRSNGEFLSSIITGFLWAPAILLAEAVQTFLLVNFYYIFQKNTLIDGFVIGADLLTCNQISSRWLSPPE